MRVPLSIFLFVACMGTAYADELLGVSTIEVEGAGSGQALSLSVWYPATSGTPEEIGGSAVFMGVSAVQNAPIVSGKLPLVLVSHGGLRSADNSGAWLASALAQAGRIAVEINGLRPHSATEAVDEIWQRPDDISRALDAILENADYSARVDLQDISVVGYALGGTAALALAGGEFDAPSFIQSCADSLKNPPDCAWYNAQNVSLDTVDQVQLIAPRRDTRVKLAVAINPEYAAAFSNGGDTIEAQSLLINLGRDEQSSSAIQTKKVTHSVAQEANLFDGFGLCTPAGPTILVDDGGNPDLCGYSREERVLAHLEVVDKVESFLLSVNDKGE
ncbi:alpha/beta hydrolase family protein [Granulosicoccus antarcticus]|uniref:Dienelactone hydrolase n=1 Tax=Granulosicoccus antarcticus IMCC3135 TaxID=1192854 RepID=A0A2Z2NU12_9GAMM|nr:hypothetical protein [Granulosicoccus antarcticus]ASJ73228.1 hypothetical protein IMCC3135_15730 [Granulosicoccus antarcticus IMCC3135]